MQQFCSVFRSVQIYTFILYVPPEAFHENIVQCSSFAVHAYLYAILDQDVCEGRSRKLASLVGIEDIRLAVLVNGLLEQGLAELAVMRIGNTPGKHVTRVPVDDRAKIHVAVRHRNVGDVRTPYLIDVGYLHVS